MSSAKAAKEIAPDHVREARKASDLTQAQAAPLVNASIAKWQNEASSGRPFAAVTAATAREFGRNSLGTRISTLREAGALTRADLANAIGVTEATISAWETGDSLNLKLQTFLRILDVLGVAEPEYLIRGTDW